MRAAVKGDEADGGEVVVLARTHRGERERSDEHDADSAVVPASGVDVTECALAGQRRDCAGDDGGESGKYVHGEEGEEDGHGRSDLGAEDLGGAGHDRLRLD